MIDARLKVKLYAFQEPLEGFSFALKFLNEVLVDFLTSSKIEVLSRNSYHLFHVKKSCSLRHAALSTVKV